MCLKPILLPLKRGTWESLAPYSNAVLDERHSSLIIAYPIYNWCDKSTKDSSFPNHITCCKEEYQTISVESVLPRTWTLKQRASQHQKHNYISSAHYPKWIWSTMSSDLHLHSAACWRIMWGDPKQIPIKLRQSREAGQPQKPQISK